MPRVTLRVVDRQGVAVAGAHVSVPWASAPFPETAYIADGDGALTLDLGAGEYRLRADAPDGGSGEAALAVHDEEAALEICVEGP